MARRNKITRRASTKWKMFRWMRFLWPLFVSTKCLKLCGPITGQKRSLESPFNAVAPVRRSLPNGLQEVYQHMKITLLHPPLDDPTMPYHSIAHLCGHLRHNGFQDVSMRDVNIEFVSYCLEEENVRAFHAEAERRLRGFNRTAELNLLQQLEFLEIWASEPSQAEELRRAVQRLRSSDGFLDYPRYVASVRLLNRYLGFLGALCYPAGFRNFKHVARVNYCIENLQDFFNPHLAEKACSCFARFFEERLVRDPDFASSDCFGISAIYDHQLVHSLWLARAL